MSTYAPFQGPAAGMIYGAIDFGHVALLFGNTLSNCVDRIEAFLKPIGPLLGCTDARLGTDQCFYEIEDVVYMIAFVSILAVTFLISIGFWWIAVYAFRLIQKNTAGSRIATHVKIQNIRYSVRGRWRPTRHYFMAGYIIALVTCSEANQFCREGHLADIEASLSSSLGGPYAFQDLREQAQALHDDLPHFGSGEPVLGGFNGSFPACWNGEQSSWQPKYCSIGEPYRPPFDFQDLDEVPADDPRLPQPDLPMVTLMNFDRFDDQRLDVQRAISSTEENPILVNMVMFGNDGRPVGRRDSPLRTLTNEEIRTAVREAWHDYPFATFQVFSVTPTPDRLRGQGWITVINIASPGLRHPPGVLALKETHVYRRSTAFLQELQQFEAFRFPSLTTTRGLIVAADLVDRCDTTRHGHCSVLHRGQVLLLGVQHRIQGGDHLCFLVDEAQPPPTEVITFDQAHTFVQTIQTALYHAGPRQYLTILLHGFRGNTLGTRIYGAHRQRVEDLDVFAGDIMSLWHEENFEQVEVIGVHPQLLLQDSDGAINLHFLVFFSPPVRPAVLLHRPTEEGYGEFDIVEVPEFSSFALLVDYSPWHVRFPAGHLGDRLLQPADLIEIEHAMFISIEGPDLIDDTMSMLQTRTLLWSAHDTLHGRTMGNNSFRQLPPPGNGRTKCLAFSDIITFVYPDGQLTCQSRKNTFVNGFVDGLKTDMDFHFNDFVTDLRYGVNFEPCITMAAEDFTTKHLQHLCDASFANDFAKACVSQLMPASFVTAVFDLDDEEERLEEPLPAPDWETPPNRDIEKHEAPRIAISLEHLVPEDHKPRKVHYGMEDSFSFLQEPWMSNDFVIPESIDQKPCVQDWLESRTQSVDENLRACFIYTDGSFLTTKDRASWAILVCGGRNSQVNFEEQIPIDWYADIVQTDTSNELFIGAAWRDAVVAEASATIWAGLYALAHHHFDTVTFCFDALGVGQAAAGNFNYKEKYNIVHSARHVMQAVESKWGINAVFYEHIKSHRNHPANELVDTFATEVARLWLVPRVPQICLQPLFSDQKLLANLWVSSQPCFDESWPHVQEQSFIGPPRSQLVPLETTQDWTFGYGKVIQTSRTSEIHMDLRVHSHNVQSLKGKVLYYRAQAHNLRIPLVALQETSNSEP